MGHIDNAAFQRTVQACGYLSGQLRVDPVSRRFFVQNAGSGLVASGDVLFRRTLEDRQQYQLVGFTVA
jgi:hypothetical protein